MGGPEYYYLLLEPIELLAVVEEGSVRDAVFTYLIQWFGDRVIGCEGG